MAVPYIHLLLRPLAFASPCNGRWVIDTKAALTSYLAHDLIVRVTHGISGKEGTGVIILIYNYRRRSKKPSLQVASAAVSSPKGAKTFVSKKVPFLVAKNNKSLERFAVAIGIKSDASLKKREGRQSVR